MGRKERERYKANERVSDLLQKDELTVTEIEELRSYSGYGGLDSWGQNRGQFYTPGVVGEFIARVLALPKGARILEPMAGIGRLIWPYSDGYDVTAVEIDGVAAEALRKLMPNAKVIHGGIEDALVGEGYAGLIANPPFGVQAQSPVPWGKAARHRRMEAWVALLASRVVRPGGLVALIEPDGMLNMDSWAPWREWVASAFLLRASISLPLATFYHSGTSVSTSILVLQKPEAPVEAYGNYRVFFATAADIGWDSRGRATGHNDLLDLAEKIEQWGNLRLPKPSELTPDVSAADARLAATGTEGSVAPPVDDPALQRRKQMEFIQIDLW